LIHPSVAGAIPLERPDPPLRPTTSLKERRSIDQFVAALKSRGLRASASRRLIIKILRAKGTPLSAREIAHGPDGESIGLDLASVYRNLEVLEQHGLVHQIHAGKGAGRYVLALAEDREYLVCDRCGETAGVDAIELDGIRALVRQRYGYEVSFTRVPMVGLCLRCGSASESPAGDMADS
jgi:Fur family ferric uptake transcriptional regulator